MRVRSHTSSHKLADCTSGINQRPGFNRRRLGWYASIGGREASRSTSATRDGEHDEQEADPAEESHPDKITHPRYLP
jgi:hypothetical protein